MKAENNCIDDVTLLRSLFYIASEKAGEKKL